MKDGPEPDTLIQDRAFIGRRRWHRPALLALVAVVALGWGATALPRSDDATGRSDRDPVDLATVPVGAVHAARLLLSVPDGSTWAQGRGGRWVRLPPGSTEPYAFLGADGSTLVSMSIDDLASGTGQLRVRGLDGTGAITLHFPLDGPPTYRWTQLSPDRSAVAVLVGDEPLTGSRGLLQLVPVGGGPVRTIPLPGYRGYLAGAFTTRGHRLVVVASGSSSPVAVGEVDLAGGSATPATEIPGLTAGFDGGLSPGWAVSPSGRRAVLARSGEVDRPRRWQRFELRRPAPTLGKTFTAPAQDRLLAWRPDGRLVWLRSPVDAALTNLYRIVTTRPDGQDPRVESRLLVPGPDRVVGAFAAVTARD